jgi:hypothetical protein
MGNAPRRCPLDRALPVKNHATAVSSYNISPRCFSLVLQTVAYLPLWRQFSTFLHSAPSFSRKSTSVTRAYRPSTFQGDKSDVAQSSGRTGARRRVRSGGIWLSIPDPHILHRAPRSALACIWPRTTGRGHAPDISEVRSRHYAVGALRKLVGFSL